MPQRPTASISFATFTLALVIAAIAPSAAFGQVQLTGPTSSVGGGLNGLVLLSGSNVEVAGSALGNTVSSHFTGEVITSLAGGTAAGTYTGSTGLGTIVPLTVGALPVRIGAATLNANFKLVASGGNGVAGGNDPVVTLSLLSRLYQQTGAVASPSTDPWLSSIEFSQTYAQNGNGLQIINNTSGPATANYIFTPGNYYIYQQYLINTSYTSNGVIQPGRGMTFEFGGNLTQGTYSGITYTFAWQTVPAPGGAALLGLGALVAGRRRRTREQTQHS